MRIILSIILVLGLVTVTLSQIQRAAEIARWSQIYGILGANGKANALEDESVRRRFDALFLQDRTNLPLAYLLTGAFISVLSASALYIHVRDERTRRKA